MISCGNNVLVSLEQYERALRSLELALAEPKTDITRDASIQRFEFCVELGWKTAKRFLGTDSSAPKTVVREMGRDGLIDDVEAWLKAIDQRNLTSHTYQEKLAEEVYSFAKEFIVNANKLLEKLKNK